MFSMIQRSRQIYKLLHCGTILHIRIRIQEAKGIIIKVLIKNHQTSDYSIHPYLYYGLGAACLLKVDSLAGRMPWSKWSRVFTQTIILLKTGAQEMELSWEFHVETRKRLVAWNQPEGQHVSEKDVTEFCELVRTPCSRAWSWDSFIPSCVCFCFLHPGALCLSKLKCPAKWAGSKTSISV